MNIGLSTVTDDMVNWFQLEFPHLTDKMRKATHHYDTQTLNAYHVEGDVWTHTMMVALMAKHFAGGHDHVRWSALLHDTGKPDALGQNHENKRVSFHGHEGLSAFLALDVLNKTNMTTQDKILIHKIIANHGDLFRFIKSDGTIKQDILNVYAGEKQLLENLVHQVMVDSLGRFWQNGKCENISVDFSKLFQSTIDALSYAIHPMKHTGKPKLTVLVGPPCAGKSTHVKNNITNTKIISRDDLVDVAGARRGLNYTDTFKFLNENADICRKEVDEVFESMVRDTKHTTSDVLIDMTCMSKKSRRRWINEFHDHDARAVVFLTGFETLKTRNKIRAHTGGKFIPERVLTDMCLRYSLPMYSEGFNEIEFVVSE